MARMTVRSTYALDQKTAHCIRSLADIWGVSQAEVIRRSVRQACDEADNHLSPADVVAYYRNNPLPRSQEDSAHLSATVRDLRHDDDERRGVRQ